jgi:hypothetical protein
MSGKLKETRSPDTPIGRRGSDHQSLPLSAQSYQLLLRLALHPKYTGPCCRLSSNPPALLEISPQEAENHQNFEQVSLYFQKHTERHTKNYEKKLSPKIEAKAKVAEDTSIIFRDFEAALKDIVDGGASGFSMATANMIKGWSTKICHFAYTHTCLHYGKCERPLMDEGQATKNRVQGP